jgi:ribonuclease HII
MTPEYEKNWWPIYARIAGIDEAGRGPLAGPVVAAAVMFEKNFEPTDDLKRINDSKQLSRHMREILFTAIYERALSVGVGIVSPETIDRINILQATFLAMQEAIAKLSPVPDFLLVDGNRFVKPFPIPVETVVKGDSKVFSIAAASIIAKVTRDRLMTDLHREFPDYNFQSNMGYGTTDHVEAIRQFGRCPIHRKSFKLAALNEK